MTSILLEKELDKSWTQTRFLSKILDKNEFLDQLMLANP